MVIQHKHIEALAHDMHKSEGELRELAVEIGLRQLWRERTLGQFVRGEITREQAIQEAGLDWVILAEQQTRAVNEDFEWATQQPSPP